MRKTTFNIIKAFVVAGLVAFEFNFSFAQTEYTFHNYTSKDGLASDVALSIRQDSLGYIWVQYYGALSRFDGYTFKIYSHNADDSKRSNIDFLLARFAGGTTKDIYVTQEHQDERGRKLLVKYDAKSDAFVRYETDTIPDPVYEYFIDDRRGCAWIGRFWAWRSGPGLYCYDFKTGKTESFLNPHPNDSIQQLQNTWMMFKDLGKDLLVSTPRGLWLFNKDKKTFRRPQVASGDSTVLYRGLAVIPGPGSTSFSWIDAGDRILKLDSTFSITHQYLLPKDLTILTKKVIVDDEEVIWFAGTKPGLHRYDPRDSSLVTLTHDPAEPRSLVSNDIADVFVDKDQNIWVATNRGVSVLRRQSLQFNNASWATMDLTAATIYKTAESDYLLVNKLMQRGDGLPSNQIMAARLIPERLSSLNFQPFFKPVTSTPVLGIYQGKEFLWAVAYAWRWNPGGIWGYKFDPNTPSTQMGPGVVLRGVKDNLNTIRSHAIGQLWEDAEGNLLVPVTFPTPHHGNRTSIDLVRMDMSYGTEGSVIHFKPDVDRAEVFRKDDRSGWLFNWVTRKVSVLNQDTNLVVGQLKTMPITMHHSVNGSMHVGTQGELLRITEKNGHYVLQLIKKFPDAEINSIQEDKSGRLWLRSGGRLLCYDSSSQITTEFTEAEGIRQIFTTAAELLKTSNGVLLTISNNSIMWFDPNTFKLDHREVRPVFTRLVINNTAMNGCDLPGDDEFKLSASISMLKELVIDFQHNNFAIEFSAMQMTAPEKNLYQHKLEGYDEDWIETDYKNRTATYTNLDPGTYTFRVKASNHHGVWSGRERSLLVTILPPPWKTWWAYTGYSLIVFGLLFGARRMIVQRERLHANLDLAKVEQEKEHFELEKAKEVDQLKSRFFANISHEFRTPITLVLGPLKDFQRQITNPEQKSLIGSVIRNGQRLQRLINQLLDLSKVEAGKMGLHASYLDLVQLLREMASSYESLAKEKNIRYFFYPEVKELMVYVDAEKIEKIIHNLLSNAFKFTKESGEVILNLRVQEKTTIISVSDTGIGISLDQVDKIFDRFYQVDNSQTRGYEGTGLGLALAKDLIELHHGKISVNSVVGKGTTFTVTLPLGKEHLQTQEIVDERESVKTEILSEDYISSNGGGSAEIKKVNENEIASENPVLLIVEDNADMRQYIRKTLAAHYQIVEAENGKAGVKEAQEIMPDLIISDIMMPEMDGYKLCSLIKTNELTSHIPVILLTAKADRDSKLSGLEIGADDYLAKPFDADELKLIIRNRIEQKRKMQERFSREITLEPRQLAVTSLDEQFITKVMRLIEAHMDDEHFSIEDFSSEAGYSRMQFYRKIKGLTDQTPSQFVRSIRLKRAAQLLAAKSDNVTQIAYGVGFSSLAYFNKCFKEQFGVTPGQYAKEDE